MYSLIPPHQHNLHVSNSTFIHLIFINPASIPCYSLLIHLLFHSFIFNWLIPHLFHATLFWFIYYSIHSFIFNSLIPHIFPLTIHLFHTLPTSSSYTLDHSSIILFIHLLFHLFVYNSNYSSIAPIHESIIHILFKSLIPRIFHKTINPFLQSSIPALLYCLISQPMLLFSYITINIQYSDISKYITTYT